MHTRKIKCIDKHKTESVNKYKYVLEMLDM